MFQSTYTTQDNIQRRWVGRLSIPSLGNSIGQQEVDEDLLSQVVRQKEAMLNNYLRMVYQFPLQLSEDDTRYTLAEIIELLTLSDLLSIYYRGGTVPQTGVEPSSLAGNYASQAQTLIQVYITGHNMFVPGNHNSSPNLPNGGVPQPVVLPGEILRGNPIPDTITKNYTYTGSFKSSSTNSDLFDFSGETNRALDAEYPRQ